MKFAISFLFGVLIGAVVPLLFTPSSGKELRSNIKKETDVQVNKAMDELQKSMNDLQDQVDKLSNKLNSRKHRTDQEEVIELSA
jgi:gas vesicle protein